MEFFSVKIREGQKQKGGEMYQSPIMSLMEIYINKSMITLETGKEVLHFEYLIKSWCSINVYILYHLKKYEIEQKKHLYYLGTII